MEYGIWKRFLQQIYILYIYNVNLKSEYSCEINGKMIPEHLINDGVVFGYAGIKSERNDQTHSVMRKKKNLKTKNINEEGIIYVKENENN